MTDDLRTRMHLVADEVTPLPVDHDLWQRGISARRRGQAFAVAAVLAVVVSVGGVATLVSGADREARTASTEVVEGGAIPRRITDISDDVEVTTDLAVGRGSAAFVSATTDPVMITAVDGVAHRLGLPGWVPDQGAIALSPDGRYLAWHQDSDLSQAAIAVLDVVTGRTRTSGVNPDQELRLRELSWSPDSEWLAWIGDGSGGTTYVGRLGPVTAIGSVYVPVRATVPDVAVSSDGTLVLSQGSSGLFRTNGIKKPTRISRTALGAGRFSPDGRLLALRSSPDPVSHTFDTSTGRVLDHPFPDGTFADGFVRPQGWLDDRLQLLLVQDSVNRDSAELVVTTPEVDRTSTWRRSVGVVEVGPATTLSLAVDLIPDLDGTSSQQLTYDFPAPPQRDISWIIGLGVAAAIAVAMGLRWLWRRYRGV